MWIRKGIANGSVVDYHCFKTEILYEFIDKNPLGYSEVRRTAEVSGDDAVCNPEETNRVLL